MAQFINDKKDIVQEALDGLVSSSGGRLLRLDGYPFIRVIVRADWDKSKVALISGGGSGHEPAHAGFVGQGMLTAAVCGDVFASPSTDAVLAGILAVTGEAGCVLIVKNYTGDRLNFGLAAERARSLGLKVNMIVVQDDIAIPDIVNPRGVAGALFVHKIAGAAAEAGGDLDTVTQAAHRAANTAFSIGMALTTCTVPYSVPEDRIPTGEIELGLGIHGEPGVSHIPYHNARQAMAEAVSKLAPRLDGRKYAALLNNLGGATELEMSILTDALRNSAIGAAVSHIIGPASLMTALDMHGFSVSLYPLNSDDKRLLAAPTQVQAWPDLMTFSKPQTMPLPAGLIPVKPTPSFDPKTAELLTRCCQTLIAAETDLNGLDAKSGDGDTGTTLATASQALIDRLDLLPLANPAQLCRALGQDLAQYMGGSSGVLLAIFFSSVGKAAGSGQTLDAALKVGLARLQEVGGARIGDRTMVDALAPALDALGQGLDGAARAARIGANGTAAMTKTQAGRASYVSAEQLEGHIDPGAEAVARLFESLARPVFARPIAPSMPARLSPL